MLREDGGFSDFEPGCFYLMPSNLYQCFETDTEERIDHIYFDFYTSPPIISDAPLVFRVEDGSPLAAQVSLMERLIPEKIDERYPHPKNFGGISDAPPGSVGEYCQLICELLHMTLILLSGERELPYIDDELITGAVEHIRASCASPLSIDLMAQRAGFEKSYFIRRFKRVMGITPYAYLRSYRLMRARELIAAGETVVRAAELVGYENASSLSRALSGQLR